MARQVSSTHRRAGTPRSTQRPAEDVVDQRAGADRARRRSRVAAAPSARGGRRVAHGMCVLSRCEVRGSSTRNRAPVVDRARGRRPDPAAVQVGDPAGDRRDRDRCRRPRSGSVPKRSKTRSRSWGAMPGPWSATSSAVARPRRLGPDVHDPPAGLCRAALSSRLASSWCSRARSAYAERSGGSTRTSKVTPRWLAPGTRPRLGHHGLDARGATGCSTRSSGDHAGVDAGEVEQVVDEVAQPLGLGARDVHGLGVGRGDAVVEVLEHRDQRRQRRAQLVGDARDQVAALPVDGREVGGHRVEGAGQLADLVGGVGLRPGRRSRRRAIRRAASVICRSGEVIPTASSWVTREGEQHGDRDAQPGGHRRRRRAWPAPPRPAR